MKPIIHNAAAPALAAGFITGATSGAATGAIAGQAGLWIGAVLGGLAGVAAGVAIYDTDRARWRRQAELDEEPTEPAHAPVPASSRDVGVSSP